MTTFRTGNPLGSTAVKDVYDNSENLDDALNDLDHDEWEDRFGRPRKTYRALERLSDPGTAVAAAERAENARDDAVDAASLAQNSSNTVWRGTKAELDQVIDRVVDTPGMVTDDPNDSDENPVNGQYRWNGSAWERTEFQPANKSDIQVAVGVAEQAQDGVQRLDGLVRSTDGGEVVISDLIGRVGLRLGSRQLLTGAGGWRRTDDGRFQHISNDGQVIRESIPTPADSPWAYALADGAGYIGFGIKRNGDPVLKGGGPTPQPVSNAPAINLSYLRNVRMRMNYLARRGGGARLNIGILGDSFTDGPNRYITTFARRIMREYGDGGGGWIGLGWNGTPSHGNARQNGGGITEEGTYGSETPYGVSQPSQTGDWTCDFTGGGGPDLSAITSSAPGAEFTFSYYPDKAVAMVGGDPINMTALRLFYNAQEPCTIEYAWNGSETWTQAVLAASGGPSYVSLGTPPTGQAWVRVRLVSGTLRAFGAYAYANTTGVVISKLGANGTAAKTWADADEATFVASLGLLPLDVIVIILGTNDQGQQRSAEQFLQDMVTLYNRARAARPVADILIVMPEENVDPVRAPYPMAGYTALVRQFCAANHVPFIDLQPYFGASLDYGPDGDFPLLIDVVHPDGATGGQIIADTLHRAFTTTL